LGGFAPKKFLAAVEAKDAQNFLPLVPRLPTETVADQGPRPRPPYNGRFWRHKYAAAHFHCIRPQSGNKRQIPSFGTEAADRGRLKWEVLAAQYAAAHLHYIWVVFGFGHRLETGTICLRELDGLFAQTERISYSHEEQSSSQSCSKFWPQMVAQINAASSCPFPRMQHALVKYT
jgi:hypothetical protein